jgi:hypothetical protein
MQGCLTLDTTLYNELNRKKRDLVIQDQNIAVGAHPTPRTTFLAHNIAHLQLLHAPFYCIIFILNAVETLRVRRNE